MKDYYQILGVERTAGDDVIKQAYRRLASQHHPDKGGETTRFQEIQEAYATLSDSQRRQQYDAPPVSRMHVNAESFDFDTIFGMFGTKFADSRTRSSARIQLWITMQDVALGGPRTIAVSSPAGQQNIEISIPVGIDDGVSVRYSGVAPGGVDLVVVFRIRPEPGWQRQDQHLVRDMSVSIWDMLLGADIELLTLSNKTISVTVPPNTQPGTMLRVRGHGFKQRSSGAMGDLFVRFLARLPEHTSPDLLEHIRRERDR